MPLRTFRIGDPASTGDALRLATTRRPPRGVRRADWPAYFDVWLPLVAPSPDLLARAHRLALDRPPEWKKFERAYTREMSRSEPRQTIALLAALAQRWPIAIGCYCENESRCHRSILRRLIERSGNPHL